MDLNRDVIYRNFKLNDSAIKDNIVVDSGVGSGISGCVIDSSDFSDVDVVQFLEKRSLSDGMDAGDVFLGARRLRMAGTLYGLSRALLFDKMWDLRAALSPTLAQREEPGDKGYRPLYFSVPTNRVEDYVAGAIDMRVVVLPKALQFIFQKDQQGGEDTSALALPWQATFLMKDPRIQGNPEVDLSLSATTVVTGATATAATNLVNKVAHGLVAGDRVYFTALTGGLGLVVSTGYYVIASGLTANAFKVSLTSGGAERDITSDASAASYAKVRTDAGNFVNRGNYHTPLNALFVVGAQSGTITLTAGGTILTITVPASTGTRTIRVKGDDKLLTVEENGDEELRMDLITSDQVLTQALIPGGTSPYSVTYIGTVLQSGSHAWFWESYA